MTQLTGNTKFMVNAAAYGAGIYMVLWQAVRMCLFVNYTTGNW
jgi:hypothetical protein